MAINITTQLFNSVSGYLTKADGIRGTYIAVDRIQWVTGDPEWSPENKNSLMYRDDNSSAYGIPTQCLSAGTICHVNDINKYYTWNGTSWEEGIKGVQMDKIVTSISSTSTDDQYPSAKCVYGLIGDIESLLGGI